MDPKPLDYQPTHTTPRESPLPLMTGGLIAGFLVAIFLAALSLVALRFGEVYKDFNLTAPMVTQAVLETAFLLDRFYYVPLLTIPALFTLLFPLLGRNKNPVSSNRRLLRFGIGGLLLLLFVIVVSLITVVALSLPMINLMEGMSGGPKR